MRISSRRETLKDALNASRRTESRLGSVAQSGRTRRSICPQLHADAPGALDTNGDVIRAVMVQAKTLEDAGQPELHKKIVTRLRAQPPAHMPDNCFAPRAFSLRACASRQGDRRVSARSALPPTIARPPVDGPGRPPGSESEGNADTRGLSLLLCPNASLATGIERPVRLSRSSPLRSARSRGWVMRSTGTTRPASPARASWFRRSTSLDLGAGAFTQQEAP